MTFCPEDRFKKETCTGCGICEKVCPSKVITLLDGYPSFKNHGCIACGHCGVFCPENAFGLDPLTGDAATPDQYRALLETRRSIRFYSDKEPSEEEINTLISIVSQSPTGVNQQGITVRVIRGKDAVGRLMEPVRKLVRILSYSGIPQIAGRITGMSHYIGLLREGEDVIFRGAPVVLFFHVPRKNATCYSDGVIAASAVMNYAVSMRMGTLWNGIAEKLYPLIRKWHTKETRGKKLTAVLCIGYPSVKPGWKAPARTCNVLK